MNKHENKKSIKKSLILGGIAVLLTLIGITGGNTYAKYATSKEAQGTSATVAKWGYVVTADADNLFSNEYGVKEGSATMTYNGSGLGVSASTKTVAPGTSGSMKFGVKGNAEVAAELNISFNITNDVHLGDYYPIKWTLTNGANTLVDGKALTDVANAVNVSKAPIAAGTTLTSYDYTLSWVWAFESSDDNNAKDTTLGQIAAGEVEASENDSVKVAFNLTISVEQVAK